MTIKKGPKRKLTPLTRLERFIIENGIKPAHLSVASGYSRQHLLRIRMGRTEPSRRCISAILAGMRRLTRQNLTVLDLFEFEDGPAEAPGGKHETRADSR